MLGYGQEQGEFSPLSRFGKDADISALSLGDLSGQIQSDANALYGIGGGGAVKPLEDLGLLLLRDSGAGIGDIDAAEQFVEDGLDGDAAACGRVLNRVVQKIADGLRRPLGVKERTAADCGGQSEADMPLRRFRGELGGAVPQQREEGRRAGVQNQDAGLQSNVISLGKQGQGFVSLNVFCIRLLPKSLQKVHTWF